MEKVWKRILFIYPGLCNGKLIGNGCWRSYGRGEEPGKGIFLLPLMIQVEFDSSDQVVISAMELSRFLDTYSVSETI